MIEVIVLPNLFIRPLILACALYATIAAAADDCGYVRLDDPGGSMSHVQMRDQTIGNCYAEAAAELVDAYRFSHGDSQYNKITSAEYLAINSGASHSLISLNAMINGRDPAGGSPISSLNYARSNGVCLFNGVPTDRSLLDSKTEAVLSDLENIYQDLARWRHITAQSQELYQTLFCDASKLQNIQAPPRLSDILDLSLKKDELATLGTIYSQMCKSQIQQLTLPVPENHGTFLRSQSAIRSDIDHVLNQSNAQPVAIEFDANVLRFGRQYSAPIPILEAPTLFQHAAVIIGRRRSKNGTCQYLLRNSWGNSCDVKKKQGFVYSKDWDCFGGNLWIDADRLSNSMYSSASFTK